MSVGNQLNSSASPAPTASPPDAALPAGTQRLAKVLGKLKHFSSMTSGLSCIRDAVRPALVVSTDALSSKAEKYFLAMITSAQHARTYGDVPISDLRLAGLPGESIVRPSKIATFEEASLVRRVGTLTVKDRKDVSTRLREFCCIGEKA